MMVRTPLDDGYHKVQLRELPAVVRPGHLLYVLSGAMAVVTAAGAGLSLSFPSILSGVPAANGNLRGTALIMILVGIPVLIAAMTLTRRGSARGLVVWLGALGYLCYQAVMFCFATPLNNLFLLYVAQLSLAGWSIVVLLRFTDFEHFSERLSPLTPFKRFAWIALVIITLNATAWLVPIIPAVLSSEPQSLLAGSGLLTNPVYVQDLAIWLPLFTAAAVAGYRRRSWGLLGVGAMLTMTVLECVGIATDQWFGSAADPGSPISSATMTPVFAAIALILALPLTTYLRNIDGYLRNFDGGAH
jgi:hypothetical protein